MELTGKCLSDFNQFLYVNYPNDLISEKCGYGYGMFERDLEQLTYILPQNMNNALIIDFFDSVGIVININVDTNNEANSCEDGCENCDSCYDTWNPEYEYCIYTFTKIENNTNDYVSYFCEDKFDLRTEATNSAIEKANEIYNQNK